MIYLFYIIKEGGLPIWSYRYPQLPKELRERLIGKDESILSGLIRAIWDMGMEVVGVELKVISFGPLKVVLRQLNIGDVQALAVAFVDSEDHPRLVRRIIDKFIRENMDKLLKLEEAALTDPMGYRALQEDLKSSFTALLLKHMAKIEVAARRNFQSYLFSVIVGVIVFGVMLGLTLLLNAVFNLIEEPEKLFYVILIFDFLVPSLFVGVFAGSSRNAIASGITLGIIAISVIYLRWSSVIHYSASALFKVQSLFLIILGILILGVLIGGGFGIFAAAMAFSISEMRWLSPPKETLKKPSISESIKEIPSLLKKELFGAFKKTKTEEKSIIEAPPTSQEQTPSLPSPEDAKE